MLRPSPPLLLSRPRPRPRPLRTREQANAQAIGNCYSNTATLPFWVVEREKCPTTARPETNTNMQRTLSIFHFRFSLDFSDWQWMTKGCPVIPHH